MKTLLVFSLVLLLAFPAAAPEVKPSPKSGEDKSIVECVVALVVLGVGTYVIIKIVHFCRDHLGDNPPPDTEDEDWTAEMAPPYAPALPVLRSIAGATGGDSLQSSSDCQTWTTEFSFAPSIDWTNRTVTYVVSRCGREVASKTVPIVNHKAYFDFRCLNVPEHAGANLFRTSAQ